MGILAGNQKLEVQRCCQVVL